jgi:hypothetical protein
LIQSSNYQWKCAVFRDDERPLCAISGHSLKWLGWSSSVDEPRVRILKATAWRELVGDVVVVGPLELECLVSLRCTGGAYEQYRWRLDQLHTAEAVKPARPGLSVATTLTAASSPHIAALNRELRGDSRRCQKAVASARLSRSPSIRLSSRSKWFRPGTISGAGADHASARSRD